MTLPAPVAGFLPRSSRFWTLGDPDAPEIGFNAVDPHGIEWAIADPRGWHVSPPVNLGLQDKPTDGAWFGRGAYKPRVVEISGAFRALCHPGAVADALDDAAERLQLALDPATSTRLAVTEKIRKELTVRPSSEVDVSPVVGHTRARRFSFVLTAADPWKYAAGTGGLETAELGLFDPTSVPGLTHPVTHPLDHGGASESIGGRRNLVNVGQAPALPIFRIVGPAPYPTISNATTGETFTVDRFLGPGVEAVIDTEMRTVHVGGSSDYSAKGPRSTFWTLARGTNDVRFTVAGTYEPTARAFVSWRPRWK